MFQEETGEPIELWFLSRVLKRVLGMKYCKPQKVAHQANSVRCLVQRQLYAKKVLSLMEGGSRLFGIDESWINELSGNQRSWKRLDSRNTVNKKAVYPRLSVIVAIDNFGSMFMAMTQVNTDHDVFQLFLTKLAAKLTQETPGW